MLAKQSNDILRSALPLVHRFGWQGSIREALRAHGMSEQGASLFAKDDLVRFHYTSALEELRAYTPQAAPGHARLRELFIRRLLVGNEAIGPARLGEAIKLSLRTSPLSTPFACLSEVADELWHLAGDRSSDTTWYARRGSLLAAYAACEAFQSQDLSRGFRDTRALADSLLAKLELAEHAEQSVTEWLAFNVRGAFNVARTWR